MNGKKADMVFTDPPYGMSLDTDYSKMPSTKELGNKNYNKVIGDNNDFSPDLIHTVFACFDYCKEIFMWGADYYAEYLPHKNNGSWIVWDKRCDEKFDKMIGSGFELCWSKAKHKRMLARINNTLFSGEADARNKVHPTQKPIKLVLWFFDYFSLKDKKNVVDLYGGSGSTLIASEKVGKNSFLMELDPNYCDVIIKRWQEFTGKIAIHADTNKPFAEVTHGNKKEIN
jgi:DNA modification methylase